MLETLLRSNKHSDCILILTEQSWSDYEKLSQENCSYLASYLSGVICIVSPSRNHERIAATIGILINAYCRKYQIPYFALGSKDIRQQFVVGKQPDVSYCFMTEKDTPDLAIEVNYTSGSINDLEKYKLLNVPEVWIWQNNSITFYRLKDDKYITQSISSALYNSTFPLIYALDSDFLNRYIIRGLTEDNLTIETEFFDAL